MGRAQVFSGTVVVSMLGFANVPAATAGTQDVVDEVGALCFYLTSITQMHLFIFEI